jgi:molecular chaperone HtpG
MLTDEKFYEKATGFALYKNLSNEYATLDEYMDKVREQQVDKDGNMVLLYTNDPDAHYTYIERAKAKGYDVLLMDGELDVHCMSQAEQKHEKLRFVRIDSDTIENLIKKEDTAKDTYTDEQKEGLRKAFEALLPSDADKLKYNVTCEAAAADALPVFLTQNEFMRRMKEMAAHQQGMSFYGQMPDSYNLVLNTNHPAIQALVDKTEGQDERMKQLIDIALLASGQLKGEALAKFVNRSVELL